MVGRAPGKDGQPMRSVTGCVIQADAPTLFEYDCGMGMGQRRNHRWLRLTQRCYRCHLRVMV